MTPGSVHIARCLHVAAADRPDYQAIIRNYLMPCWHSLRRAGLLCACRVFELFRVEAESQVWPDWAYLHLVRLPEGLEASEFMQREEEIGAPAREISSWLAEKCQCRRIEALELQPSGGFPEPGPQAEQRQPEVYFWIEYIDVRQDALAEYRQSMLHSSYPAIGDLVRHGTFHSFMALETMEVLQKEEGMPPWNQIHICGLYGSRPASVAMGLFSAVIGEYDGQGRERIWKRLAEIRVKPREDLSRELRHLSLHESDALGSGRA